MEKQKHMCAIAARTLLTDKGKSLVRAHADSGDAQRAYSLLQMHASKSTMASVDGSALTGCITAAKLGTGTNWRGSAHSFILHWQDQVRKYVALDPQKNKLQDNFLLTMLQNAVNPDQLSAGYTVVKLRCDSLHQRKISTSWGIG